MVNNNTNRNIAPIAGESKPTFNPSDKKIQQVSKGFFSSFASFFGKAVKAIVIVATFPVSLPLMYLASKMKKATQTSPEIKQETVVAPKEEIQKEFSSRISKIKKDYLTDKLKVFVSMIVVCLLYEQIQNLAGNILKSLMSTLRACEFTDHEKEVLRDFFRDLRVQRRNLDSFLG